MQVAANAIGAVGEYTFSAVIQQDGGGRFVSTARVFDHSDPSVTLPSGTTPRHVVTPKGVSLQVAIKALEDALTARLGPLRWVRWRLTEDAKPGRS